MLYKFKSKASGDLIMLEPNGRRVLEIIGKDTGAKGIVLPEQMPAAIAALEAAMAQEEPGQPATAAAADASESGVAPEVPVGLRQRIFPFVEMLKRSHKAGSEVVWGV